MTYKMEDIKKMLQETGLPIEYHHFDVKEAIEPPFLVYLFPESDNMSADNRVYQKIQELDLELYTDKKDLDAERKIERLLDREELFWEKTEVWLENEKLYEVLYKMEVLISEEK